MNLGTIWEQLALTLDESPTLSKYVQYVYHGRRYDIEADSLPCIMLEPVTDNEIIKEISTYKELEAGIEVYAFCSNNYAEFEKTIVGDQNYVGIVTMVNDIRAVLQSSNTLGNLVIDTIIDEIYFDQIDFNKYPVRGALIPLRIKYRQLGGE